MTNYYIFKCFNTTNFHSTVCFTERTFRRLGGFQIYFANETKSHDRMEVYKDDNLNYNSTYNILLPNVLTRIIRIQRPGILTICEVLLSPGGTCSFSFLQK